MLRGSQEFEDAITGSHAASVRAEAWLGGRRIVDDLPLVAGSVSSDSGQFVRRQASLTFADETGASMDALSKTLSRPGVELRVFRGVRVGSRTHELPVHWGLCEAQQSTLTGGTLQVSSPDRAQRIAYDRFVRPRASMPGFTVSQQIQALVRETLGTATRFVDESQNSTAVPSVVWDRDRNDAVASLANSVACDTWFRPDGSWVLRRVPSVIGLATFRVQQGVNLEDVSRDTDWSQVKNHWVAMSDRGDGAALFGEDFDNDSTSPTYVFGPMGRRTAFYSSSLFTTSAQCVQAARAFRFRSQGARVAVEFTSLLHPGIEAGDRVDVSFSGDTYRLVLDSFQFDLFSAAMSGRARSADAIPEES